jgi:Small-conductance mechanosensitive channel
VLYIFALFIAVENLGMKMTVIWGGAAALLVGVGLGLQQTFNDFFSGILLLFERSVQVGDVVNLDGMIATVKRIGLRTSLLETRESVSIIVPNSKLVTNNVINWSYYDQKARFWITVGVAYGSDTELVKKLLIESAKRQEAVLAYPKPLVRFVDFADSSLNFELHFWTTRFMYIEDLKSDIRFEVDKVFRANDIQIPFPQRDVWMRK